LVAILVAIGAKRGLRVRAGNEASPRSYPHLLGK
jgi:hypothetical protein